MNRFAITTSMIIRCFFIFIIAYLWATFLFPGFIMTFVFAFLVMCLANFFIMAFQSRKLKKKHLTRAEQEHMQSVLLQLKFLKPAEALVLFKKALEKKLCDTSDDPSGGLAWGGNNMIETQNFCFFPMFHKVPTDEDIIAALHKTPEGKKTVVGAIDFPPAVLGFFAGLKLDVVLMDGGEVFNQLLLPTETYPEVRVEKRSRAKITRAALRQMFLNPKKTRSFVFIGIIIMLTSLIVRPTIYYVIVATVVFGLALAGRLQHSTSGDNLW